MSDEIKVHVVKYLDRKNLVMRYIDPLTNKQVSRSTKTANTREAERAAAVWQSELREGRYKALCKMTWDEFRDKYEAEVLPGLAESTAARQSSTLNYVESTINPQRVAELTTPRLSAFVSKLRTGGMKETTLAAHVAHLKPVLRWAVRQGYLRAMPGIDSPTRAKGITRTMRGRPLTGEELDRVLDKVATVRKRETEKWKTLIHGLWLSGLRLGEAVALSWDDDAAISVVMSGKYPALRIFAESQKNHTDTLLPLSPEFAEFLLAVPKAERRGLVFGIYGPGDKPLSTKRVCRYISRIGKAANVVTNKAEGRYATAHDLRRSFGSRWARKVTPAVLRELMRHKDISTTMTYYAGQAADDIGDVLRSAVGNSLGNNGQNTGPTVTVDIDANGVSIDTYDLPPA